jgi:2-polyprenyl-3-methyl-5-hydroxy-6-metoxy-1,4-benzoquinol methylase
VTSYDEFASEYATLIRSRDKWGFSPYLDLVVPALLQAVGDVRGKRVLDACCGEGYFTRLLADQGAQIVGIDISPRFIGMAAHQEEEERRGITYLVHDLTQPLPQYTEYFDWITCNLALNDVPDYRALIANMSAMLKWEGQLALSMNNPYSAVIRGKVDDYFDSGRTVAYVGLAAGGVPAMYHHYTLEDHMREFKRNGLCLTTLFDVKPNPEQLRSGSPRPKQYYRFPYFMVLGLIKHTNMHA